MNISKGARQILPKDEDVTAFKGVFHTKFVADWFECERDKGNRWSVEKYIQKQRGKKR